MSNERELFEQWAKLNGYDLTPSKTYETGYESDATTYAKAGFQAGFVAGRASTTMQDDVRKDAEPKNEELGRAIRANYETAKKLDVEYIKWTVTGIDQAIYKARE